uniref:Receptor ligand binding region domain-containing protein n=1 Tax=Salvator merianae TaxID=96440 RepID=A0A8D0BRP1_SALMN
LSRLTSTTVPMLFTPIWCWKNRDKAEECHYDLLLYQSIEIFFTFSTPCRLMPVPKNYQRILAFVFATHEVNKNPFLLPNITMGFHIYDYRENPIKTYEVSLSQLSAQGPFIPNYNCNRLYRLQSVIGGLDSKSSWNMAPIFGIYKIPDKTQFPFIYRMVPKEDTHYPGIIKLLLHFKWTWIGLLVPDTDNGERFLRTFTSLLFSNGICAAFSVLINLQALHLHFQSFFTWYKVNVIVYYGKVWITTALWDLTLNLSYDILSSKNIHLHPFLGNTHFYNNSLEGIYVDADGELTAQLDIVNWVPFFNKSFHALKFGSMNGQKSLELKFTIDQDAIQWPRMFNQVGKKPSVLGHQTLIVCWASIV